MSSAGSRARGGRCRRPRPRPAATGRADPAIPPGRVGRCPRGVLAAAARRRPPGAGRRGCPRGRRHRVPDRWVPLQHGLDLAELDPEAAQLDLVVDAAEELERAVGPPAHEVAGAVQPAAPAGDERVRRRTARRSAPGGRGSRGRARRRRCTARRARRRAPAGRARRARRARCWRSARRSATGPSPAAQLEHGGPDRRLGRPVHVPQRRDRASSSCSASSRGSASPPHSDLQPPLPFQPASTSSCQVVGVACIDRRPACGPAVGQALAVGGGLAAGRARRRAPTMSGRYSRAPAMSNDSVVTASSTSSAPMPGRSLHRARGG